MSTDQHRFGWTRVAFCLAALSVFICVHLWLNSMADARADAVASVPAQKLGPLNKKFEGSGSCGGNKCHDKAGDDAPPTEIAHEATIWSSKDRHAKAFKNLS